MMRKSFFLLILLFCMWLSAEAQIYYERWIDDNRAALTRGTLNEGEQEINVDVSGMPWPGLHFLNILPYEASGKPGVWKQIAFMMPEGWPGDTEASIVEYWVTGYDQTHAYHAYTGSEMSFSIDASKLSPGLHFLNFRTLNSAGEPGAWKQISFLMPDSWPGTTTAKSIEYWVSSYDTQSKWIAYNGSEVQLDIDISMMSYGLHFLNFRVHNEIGMPGPWKQVMFLIDNGIFDREPVSFQYWIDSGTKTTEYGYTPSEIPLIINIDNLSKGQHTFNYRVCYSEDPTADDAEFSETESLTFFVPSLLGDVNSDGVVNIVDVTTTINYMLGKNPKPFIKEAADIKGDGIVNITDVIGIISIVLEQ